MHHLLTGRQAPGSVNVGPNRPEDIHKMHRNTMNRFGRTMTRKRFPQGELDVLVRRFRAITPPAAGLAQDLQSLL